MVTIQPQIISKEKTVKQIVLMNNLLQSRYFSKAEFQKYKALEMRIVKTSYEASLVIAELIAKLRFRKKFNSKRCKAHLICAQCKTRKDLIRKFNPYGNKQYVVCFKCDEEFNDGIREIAELPGKILEARDREQKAVNDRNREIQVSEPMQDLPEGICARCEEEKAVQGNICGACVDELDHN